MSPNNFGSSQDCLWVGQKGLWGQWHTEWCPDGQFVRAFENRIEGDQGVCDDCDDTAMNGLRMWCVGGGQSSGPITVHEGFWGDWRGKIECPDLMMVTGLKQSFEAHR